MKKFSLFVSMLLAVTISFAQYQEVQNYLTKTKPVNEELKINKTRTDDAVWQVTFDEEEPMYTIGKDLGEVDWTVDDSTYTTGIYGGEEVNSVHNFLGYVKNLSESGGKFASFDVITTILTGTQTAHNAWVQFDNIDLTEALNPKLTFYQIFKKLNDDLTYIDFSIDQGTTWTSVNVNSDVGGNDFGNNVQEVIFPEGIGGNSDVSMRIRFNAINGNANGYGWQVDDLTIINNPDYDVKLNECFCNFFDVSEEGGDNFHYGSHYGSITDEQAAAGSESYVSFNISVLNKGNLEYNVPINITITDPENDEVYNQTYTIENCAKNIMDTVMFESKFMFSEATLLGEYTVVTTVNVENDANLLDNVDTTYFNVTDNIIARDLGNMTRGFSTSRYEGGSSTNDRVGAYYKLLYEAKIVGIDVFIDDNTSIGTSITAVGAISSAEEEKFVELWSGFTPLEITEEMLNTWVRIEFADTMMPELNNDGYCEICLGVIYNLHSEIDETNDIYIGYDPTLNVSNWTLMMDLLGSDNVHSGKFLFGYWEGGGIGIRGYTDKSENNINTNELDKISIYPNPSNGIFNIINAEGTNIQVINLMGQVVYQANNVNDHFTFDLNGNANGTYIVKVNDSNSVKTTKVNFLK